MFALRKASGGEDKFILRWHTLAIFAFIILFSTEGDRNICSILLYAICLPVWLRAELNFENTNEYFELLYILLDNH